MQITKYLDAPSEKINPDTLPVGLLMPNEKALVLRSVEYIAGAYVHTKPVFIEVGTLYGGTAEAIARTLLVLNRQSIFRTLDQEERGESRGRLRWLDSPVDAKALIGVSWDIAPQLPRPIAWCLIDPCHCYACAKQDIEVFAPMVEPGGLLLFHDTIKREGDPETRKGHAHFDVAYAIERSEFLQESFEKVYEIQPTMANPFSPIKPWGGMMVFQRKE
jgi:hypothetical protein